MRMNTSGLGRALPHVLLGLFALLVAWFFIVVVVYNVWPGWF